MSAKLFTTEDQLVNMIGKGLEAQLKGKIREKLLAIVMPEVEAIVTELAKDIASNVVSCNDSVRDKLELVVMFNKKETFRGTPS